MTDTGRTPWSEDDERAVLGTMMITNAALVAGLGMLTREDFWDLRHQAIFDVLRDLHQRDRVAVCDPGVICSELDRVGKLALVGGRPAVFVMEGEAPVTLNAAHYARRVAELAALRRGIAAGEKMTEAAYDRDAETLAAVADAARLAVVVSRADRTSGGERPPPRPWLIPGLLRSRERWILTGREGFGKSTLLRQVAVCVASGLHPFTGVADGVDSRQRVLIVDLQEEDDDIDEALGKLQATAGASYHAENLLPVSQPQGMNLLDPEDRGWLESLVASHKPGLLCIGPVRKMYRATGPWTSKSSEEAVDEVTRTLDDLRVAYDVGMLLEAHAGHGDRDDRDAWRIRGSSVWLDWPEVGMGLAPVKNDVNAADLKMWRDPRHRGRPWPTQLHRSSTWPWMPDRASLTRLLKELGAAEPEYSDADLWEEPEP